MFNEFFFLEFLIIIIIFFFINGTNILTLWYLSGLYLLILGFFLLYDECSVFVGFLWVIDLGVGLIFFIFILHFSNFLHQKSIVSLLSKNFFFIIFIFFFIVFFFFLFSNSENFNSLLKKNWFFFTSWYNFFFFFVSFNITDLTLLKEIYFYNNSFEFFLINFMLLYGLFSSIILSFLIKKIFVQLNINQIKNFNILNEINSIFFIRNQNFLFQQNVSTGSRVWLKKKTQYKF